MISIFRKIEFKGLKSKKGFTVSELMISLSIGLLISSAALYLMIQAFNGAEAMVRDYYLTLYGRILREKLVRSVEGRNGLRVSMWDSFWIQHMPGKSSEHEPTADHVHTMEYDYLDMTSSYDPVSADVKTVTITRHIDELTQVFAKNAKKNNKFVSVFNKPIVIKAMDHELVPRNDITRRPRYLRSTFELEVNIAGKKYYPFYTIKTTIVNNEP